MRTLGAPSCRFITKMATTQAQAEITERRLRPLYDAIDNGQNKKAVQMADKILKKQDDLYCAKALKGIALLRMGRQEEGASLVREVMSVRPGDQATLQAVTMFFRETGEYKKIVDLYASAAQMYPKNGDILTHLFMAYVRVGDYQKQQQTAAALSKAFPMNGPYYCWRIMSILMQAQESKDETTVNTMFYPLADRLIDRYVSENRMDGEAEVKLYLMVLDRLGRTEKKLEIIRGEYGDKFRNQDERNKVELDCLVDLGEWDEVSGKLRELLLKMPDQWSFISAYVTCQMNRVLKAAEGEGGEGGEGEGKGEGEEEGEEEGEGEGEGESREEGSDVERGRDNEMELPMDNTLSVGTEESHSLAVVADAGSSEDTADRTDSEPVVVVVVEEGESSSCQEEEGHLGCDGDDDLTKRLPETPEQASCSELVVMGGGGHSAEGKSCVEKRGWYEEARYSNVDPGFFPILEARDLFEYLTSEEQKKVMNGTPKTHIFRGPFLGRMELVKQLLKQMNDNKIHSDIELATPLCMLMDYYQQFGTKSCCFEDLRVYLAVFPEADIKEFLSQVELRVGEEPVNFDCDDDEMKLNVSRLRKHISLLQLQRFCGKCKKLSIDQKLELIKHCKHYYIEGLKLGRDLAPTLSQHSEFYSLLATHLKIELYQETGDCSYLWEAIFMLEYSKKANPQIPLLLMKLYSHVGATEFITSIYDELYIKHIQTETLGYIPLRYMQSMGTFGFAGQLYRSGLRFYYSCSKEIGEYIIQAYKNGMFQKIVEFVGLRDRFARSLNFACILVDMSLLELVSTVHSVMRGRELFAKEWFSGLPFTSSNLQDYCARLVDSRDLRVIDDWTHDQLSEVEAKISFDLECLWLRGRVVLVQCLRDAITLISPQHLEDGASDSVAIFSSRVEEFGKVLDQLNEHLGVILLRKRTGHLLPIQAPPPCLGHRFLQESHGQVVREMLSVTERVVKGATSVGESLKDILGNMEGAKSRISGVPEELRASVMTVITRQYAEGEVDLSLPGTGHPYSVMIKTRIDLECYVLFIQAVTHVVLLTAVCAEVIKPTIPGESKKKRKKRHATKNPVGQELVGFLKEVKLLLLSVSQHFQPLPGVEGDLADQLSKMFISDELEDGSNFEYSVMDRVCKGALESYNMSFRDCLEVVHAKADFIDTITRQLGGSVD